MQVLSLGCPGTLSQSRTVRLGLPRAELKQGSVAVAGIYVIAQHSGEAVAENIITTEDHV
jgi:hypothetical protein